MSNVPPGYLGAASKCPCQACPRASGHRTRFRYDVVRGVMGEACGELECVECAAAHSIMKIACPSVILHFAKLFGPYSATPARTSAARSPSRPRPRPAEGGARPVVRPVSVTSRASRSPARGPCAARRSTPSPLRSTNDAVAVLADVTVIRGRSSAIDAAEMQSETELSPPRCPPLGHVPPCPLDSFLYLYTQKPTPA